MSEMDDKRKRIERFVKGGLLAFGLLLVFGIAAPLLLAGVTALVAVGLAGIAGLLVVNLAPLVAFKFANWRLKAIKAEATRNPIETLENDYRERQTALARFKSSIQTFSTAVMNFESKLEGFVAQFPKDAQKFDGQLDKMKKLLDLRRRRYKEAEGALELYASEIQRAQAIWTMGLEAAKMNAAAGMTDDDFYAKVKVETALDSVTTTMNSAFAELETSLLEEEDEKSLPAHQPAPMLESGNKLHIVPPVEAKKVRSM